MSTIKVTAPFLTKESCLEISSSLSMPRRRKKSRKRKKQEEETPVEEEVAPKAGVITSTPSFTWSTNASAEPVKVSKLVAL